LTTYKLVWYNKDAEDERKTTVGGEKIKEARMNLIAKQAFKAYLRKDFSFRDIQKIKRNIGNTIKEPEMKSVDLTKEEGLEFADILIREVFEELMAGLKA